MRQLAELFKALSDETRLKMIVLLQRHGELCVCDFEGVLGLSQSASSRHLRHLYRAGIADSRRQGAWVHYRLRQRLEPAQQSLVLAALEHTSHDQLQALDQSHRSWLAQKRDDSCCG